MERGAHTSNSLFNLHSHTQLLRLIVPLSPDSLYKPILLGLGTIITWLESLATERCDVQIVRLLRAMFDKPDRRPDAENVWKVLTTCTTQGDRSLFCGPCCMPLVHDDLILTSDPEISPSKATYDIVLPVTMAKYPTDLCFNKQYNEDEQLDLRT